jgi:hypothetical protein
LKDLLKFKKSILERVFIFANLDVKSERCHKEYVLPLLVAAPLQVFEERVFLRDLPMAFKVVHALRKAVKRR